ncbi:MAG TPA: hypothetical protein VG649_18385 [Candidatus Angelobacter sp.]|nr:hypothetical protein [Candidatus Angelobacter sp.]
MKFIFGLNPPMPMAENHHFYMLEYMQQDKEHAEKLSDLKGRGFSRAVSC